MEFAPDVLALLFATAVLGGTIDAIAGGGGAITLPMLMSVGLSPAQALATNKLQGAMGSFSATLYFARKGHIRFRENLPAIVCACVGGTLGSLAVQQIDPSFLRTVIPFLLIAIALWFLVVPKLGEEKVQHRLNMTGFAFTAALGIGFYDGFFGPGTGTFYAIAYVMILGYHLIEATAHTKLLNFCANFSALLMFISGGNVVWIAGLAMATGQFVGGQIGARLAIKNGAKLVRPVVVVVALLLAARLLYVAHFSA